MEFVSRYVIPFKGFGYEPDSVICTLINCYCNGHRQYLLEPQSLSIADTVGLFAVLPDNLEIRAQSMTGPADGVAKIGSIRKGIRDMIKYNPGPAALALRTEVRPGSYYQLMPNHYDLVRAWIAELAKFCDRSISVKSESVTFLRIDYARKGNISVYKAEVKCYDDGSDQTYSVQVGLNPFGNLWEMRSDLDPGESLVWSPTKRKLFHGSPPSQQENFG